MYNNCTTRVFNVYFDRFVPLIGGLVSGDLAAYNYLPRSLKGFPPAHELRDRMREAGFEDVSYKLAGCGTVALHLAIKPSDTALNHVLR